jgi:hypothetical protein
MPDLITITRALVNSPSADSGTLEILVTAASQAVRAYCQRDFTQTAYDELYNGDGTRRLILRSYPIISVQSVRYRTVTVLVVQNNNTAVNQQARVSVTSTGLTLVRVASGVTTTDSSIVFATSPTLQAVATAINALGNGWSAQVVADYGNWPSADLRAVQGALNAAGQFAELRMHTAELAGFQVDERRGWLLRAVPYSDPEMSRPDDLAWPVGINNLRVQYTAGYARVPDDVQEATAQLTATLFKELGRNQILSLENTGGYAYRVLSERSAGLPRTVRSLLDPYRNRRIAIWQG